MTNNLAQLIKEYEALKQENARLRQELAELRGKHEHIGASIEVKPIYWTAPATPFEAPKLFSVHRIDTNGYRPNAVHFGIDAMPSMLQVLRHVASKQWWIIRNSDSVMIAQSKDS